MSWSAGRRAARPDLPVRIVALATAAYSIAITAAPRLLAAPTGLTDAQGTVPVPVAELTRSIGTRDAALALALAVVPAGRPLLLLAGARVVSDGADAVWFGRLLNANDGSRAQLAKVCGAAAGWAVLETVAAWWALRPHRSTPLRSVG